MAVLELSNSQVFELVRQMPTEQKRKMLGLLASDGMPERANRHFAQLHQRDQACSFSVVKIILMQHQGSACRAAICNRCRGDTAAVPALIFNIYFPPGLIPQSRSEMSGHDVGRSARCIADHDSQRVGLCHDRRR